MAAARVESTCAAVLLKRLHYALEDGHRILAVIRSTACNSDGRTRTISAPSFDAQMAVHRVALAVARLWPDVASNAVDPGWVPTRMGGPHAPDDFQLGYLTQVWLATSDEPGAKVSGSYWHHHQQLPAPAAASDPQFQDTLVSTLEQLTGAPFPTLTR